MKSITHELMATTLGTMSKMLFGSDSLPPVLPHYSLTPFTRRRMVNVNDDVIVSLYFLGFYDGVAAWLSDIGLQIAQLSPSVMQSFC